MTEEEQVDSASMPAWAIARPPQVDPSASADGKPKGTWFQRRPIPIYIISAYCILQWLAITLFMVEHWSEFMELMRTGALAPLPFAAGFVYPLILFIGGVLVFGMKKAAVYFLGAYLALGLHKVLTQNVSFPGYIDLALIVGISVYCLRLRYQKQLT